MNERRAFEIAQRHYPGGEAIVTIRRAAKVALACLDEAAPEVIAVAALREAAARGIARGIPEHTTAWREVLAILDTPRAKMTGYALATKGERIESND